MVACNRWEIKLSTEKSELFLNFHLLNLTMNISIRVSAVVLACVSALPMAATANPIHVDATDRSSAISVKESKAGMKRVPLYGRVGDAAVASRVVDITKAKYINIDCGETISFTNGKDSFSWKFDVIGHRTVDIKKIAPKSFESADFLIYVDANEYEATS